MKQMLWFWKQMIVLFIKRDFDGSQEAWYLIKIHWNYSSKKIN